MESRIVLLDFYRRLLSQWTANLLSHRRPLIEGKIINSMINHSNGLALTGIQESASTSTECSILSFYEAIVSMISHQQLKSSVRIVLPSAELVYTLQFSSSLSTISRLCSMLASYKRAFEAAMIPKPSPYSNEYVNRLNSFLMDICNCLWRGKAFNTSDTNAKGCLVPTSAITAIIN